MKQRRCQHFDFKGVELPDSPCQFASKCRYAHPNDPEWPNLPPSYLPHARLQKSNDSPRSPIIERRDPPVLSTVSDDCMAVDSPVLSSFTPRISSSRPSVKTEDPRLKRIVDSNLPPPSPQVPAPPLPPPPPPITGHGNTQTKNTNRILWEDRVKLFVDYLTADKSFERATNRYKDLEKSVASHRIHPNKEWNDQVESAKGVMNEAQATKDAALESLLASDSWPVGQQRALTSVEPDLPDKYEALSRLLEEVKIASSRFKTKFDIIQNRIESQTNEDSSSAAKKRHIDEEQQPRDILVREEVKRIKRKVDKLEEDFFDAMNDVNARESDHDEQLMSHLNARLDEGRKQMHKRNLSTIASLDAKYEQIKNKMNEKDDDLEFVKDEVVSLRKETADMREQLSTLQQSPERQGTAIRLMKRKIDEQEEVARRDISEITALKEAIAAYHERPLTPPTTPLHADYILHAFDEHITETIRAAIRPEVSQLRDKLQHSMMDRESQIYNAVWGKLALTRQTIDAIAMRVGVQPPS